jgi:hypothetical protein
MVDARDRDSAGGELGGEVARAAAEIENLLTAHDGAQCEGLRSVANGKLAVVLFNQGHAVLAPSGSCLHNGIERAEVHLIGSCISPRTRARAVHCRKRSILSESDVPSLPEAYACR